MQAVTHLNYWCYNCQQHVISQNPLSRCTQCQSEAIEQTISSSGPAHFKAYQIRQTSQQAPLPQQSFHFQRQVGPEVTMMQMTMNFGNLVRSASNLGSFENIMANSVFSFGQGIEQLLNSLAPSSHLVPTTQTEISRLAKVEIVQECPICQEEKGEQKGYQLQCGHTFHIDCLEPWLKRTNTCPCCRQKVTS